MEGHVRDNFPYLILLLQGLIDSMYIEFLIDTGFDGELALPFSMLAHLDATYSMDETIYLADGSTDRKPVYEVEIEWFGERRTTDVLILDSGIPLLGVRLMAELGIYMEITDGGPVRFEGI